MQQRDLNCRENHWFLQQQHLIDCLPSEGSPVKRVPPRKLYMCVLGTPTACRDIHGHLTGCRANRL